MIDIATLIIRGLSGDHLRGYLPGNDNKAAVARAVASKRHWSGPGYWCAATRDGLGDWGDSRHVEAAVRLRERRPDAVLFVTWAEVLDVIRRGCGDGYREAYEAAFREWAAMSGAWSDAYLEYSKTGAAITVPYADSARIHATTEALIRHGCERPAISPDGVPGPGETGIQGALWDDVTEVAA